MTVPWSVEVIFRHYEEWRRYVEFCELLLISVPRVNFVNIPNLSFCWFLFPGSTTLKCIYVHFLRVKEIFNLDKHSVLLLDWTFFAKLCYWWNEYRYLHEHYFQQYFCSNTSFNFIGGCNSIKRKQSTCRKKQNFCLSISLICTFLTKQIMFHKYL